MAFTVLASWDFRTDSSATGLASRRGNYTLTQEGTPTWSSTGVDCSGAGDRRLKMTLPAELKVSPVWFVAGFRIMNATAPSEHTNIVGLRGNSTGIYDCSFSFIRQPSNSRVRVFFGAPDSGSDGVSTASVTTGSDLTLAVARTNTNNPALKYRIGSGAWVTGLITSAPIGYASDSVLMFGTPDSEDVRTQFHWFVMGSGPITDAEAEAIQASPNTYIYPEVTGPSAATRARSRTLRKLSKR